MAVTTIDAAKYLCELSNWRLSNLQLQKILYIADMNFTGINKRRLLDEDFEAWDYGPVLPSLYHHAKAFGSKSVPDVFWGAVDISNTKEAKMIDTAWEKLKSASPGQLVAATHHSSGAWIQNYIPGARQIKISTKDMIDEFQRRRKRAK